MQRLLNILFWSIIAAAFIGPGTVTTAAASGARFEYALLWALVFSTVACLVLQEAAARITIVSGHSLAEAIRKQFHGGVVGVTVLVVVLGAVVLGCAAYEAGNILGGVAGIGLHTTISPKLSTLLVGIVAALLLFFGSTVVVARILGVVVAVMGLVFLVTAVLIKPPLVDIVRGALIPSLPDGSNLLVLGLIGTTVVPYNLFLGSGIAGGQTLGELRWGLGVAVIIGGVISMGILIVGASVAGTFSFELLSDTMNDGLGRWAGVFFAIGLFAAGFSSAITAPLAAAITARGFFGPSRPEWHEHSWRYRMVWLGVLATGVTFGLIGVRPIPAIIIAQALNGILLPLVAVFLFIVVNDRALMRARGLNGQTSNVLMGVIVVITVVLGLSKLAGAVTSMIGMTALDQSTVLVLSSVIAIALAFPIIRIVRRKRALGEGS